MGNSAIEVVGMERFDRSIQDAEAKLLKKQLIKSMRPGAKVMQREVKSETPVRTGTLKKAIRIKAGRGKASEPRARLYLSLKKNYYHKEKLGIPFYIWMVHNGTVYAPGKKRKHTKPRLFSRSEERAYQRNRLENGRVRIKPNPFVNRAFDSKVNDVAEMILSDIKQKLIR